MEQEIKKRKCLLFQDLSIWNSRWKRKKKERGMIIHMSVFERGLVGEFRASCGYTKFNRVYRMCTELLPWGEPRQG